MEKIRPNTFIVGAPKCGTTALSEYLRSHPEVFMSYPKEPEFFSKDIHFRFRSFRTYNDYLNYFFKGVLPCHRVIAEASVWYLFSSVAIPAILEYNSDAKFIVMLRNPVDMAYSLHSQMLATLDEDIADFGKAWEMQVPRRHGVNIPRLCQNPVFVQYREVCSLGTQLQRFMQIVPPKQRHVVFLEDMMRAPKQVYCDVLDFLNLPDDGRNEFEKVNENKTIKNRTLARMLKRPPGPVLHLARIIKRVSGIKRFSLHEKLDRKNYEYRSRDPMPIGLRSELLTEFKDEIHLIEQLVGRNLAEWKSL